MPHSWKHLVIAVIHAYLWHIPSLWAIDRFSDLYSVFYHSFLPPSIFQYLHSIISCILFCCLPAIRGCGSCYRCSFLWQKLSIVSNCFDEIFFYKFSPKITNYSDARLQHRGWRVCTHYRPGEWVRFLIVFSSDSMIYFGNKRST